MGVVYKARQVGLERVVALKMILSGDHAGPQQRARFRTEAEVIARLQHPNIVQIYEIGEHGDSPFLVLEYCDGGSLSAKLAGTPLPAAEAAALLEDVARGVHHAHQHGVLHRDLKPGNILLQIRNAECGVRNEKEAEYSFRIPNSDFRIAKITDFGLAKKLDRGAGQTRTGAIMGTPSYMAPEQAAARKDIGPAADIWSLGAMLYDFLTGRPPFRAATELETVMQVIERQPVPPHLLNHHVPHDLETICLKCLQKDPAKRYANAGELAEDLRRWRTGESIHAHSLNLLQMVTSNLRRSQFDLQFANWGSMMMWSALIMLLGSTAASVVLWQRPASTADWLSGIHLVMLVVLGVIFFYHHRSQGFWPSSTPERQLWVLVGGLVGACALLGFSDSLMATPERPHDLLAMYPRCAIVSGLVLFILGSSYWGMCYLFGIAFWLLAIVMSIWPAWSDVEFGLLWTVALLIIGNHLRKLGKTTT
jgi:serine/threonine-protein kinase